ncbi:MAG: zinc-binding dehydrogenase [Acidobacteriota bacterium]
MHAVRIKQHGGLEVLRLEKIPDPSAGPLEVRIRVQAAGLNHLDLWVRRGVPGHHFPLPITPGSDATGIIDQIGSGVTGLHEGDAVVVAPGLSCGLCPRCLAGDDHLCRQYGILGESCDGTNAPFLVLPARNVLVRPTCLDPDQAAAFALTFLTAWHMLVARARIQPGEWVLIHAAGSGVSSAAIQIARLKGARVIATAGTTEKLRRATALGAKFAVNYNTGDLGRKIRDLMGKRRVDVVLDHVGTNTFGRSIKLLARGGRYVFCGATSGFDLRADFRPLFFKNISILGSTMGSLAELATIRELVEDGLLEPTLDRVLPLEQVAQAHALLEQRQVFGRVVLRMKDPPPGGAT